MTLSTTRIRAIVRKELRDYRRNRFIAITMTWAPTFNSLAVPGSKVTIGTSAGTTTFFSPPSYLTVSVRSLLPTTLPTFDELLGRDGVDDTNIADALYRASEPDGLQLQVFTLHAELEGLLLLTAFEQLLRKWQAAGAKITGMQAIHQQSLLRQLPEQTVAMGTVPGRSGLLAVQPVGPTAGA